MRPILAAAAIIAIQYPVTAPAQDAASLAIYNNLEETYPVPSESRLLTSREPALNRYASRWKSCKPTNLKIISASPDTADYSIVPQIAKLGVHNAWLVLVKPSGCTETVPIRFVVSELSDGTLEAGVIGFGDSLTWSSLVHDAQIPVMLSVNTVLPKEGNCAKKPPRLVDARILSRGPSLGQPNYGVIFAGAWRELWTFTKCGQQASIPVRFQADGNGGAHFQADQTEVALLPR